MHGAADRQFYLFESFRIHLIEKACKVSRLIHNLDWPGLMICTSEITEEPPIPLWRVRAHPKLLIEATLEYSKTDSGPYTRLTISQTIELRQDVLDDEITAVFNRIDIRQLNVKLFG